MKPKSKLERFTDGIPVFFSYVIISSTWAAFTLGLSLHQTLSNRQQTVRFLTQQVIGNSLFALVLASFMTAAKRSPGSPDRSLAPSNIVPPASIPSSADPEKARTRGPPSPIIAPPGVNDDDIPLKFLRNPKWVNSRKDKARPSPLPLSYSRQRTGDAHLNTSSSSSSKSIVEGYGVSGIAPFPLNVSPFVPNSADDAGEDPDEIRSDRHQAKSFEGKRRRSTSGAQDTDDDEIGQGYNDRDRLLPITESRRQSIMAKSNTGEPRWCKKCDNWKPDRCHHCSYCRKCVLKMDHHCAWIGGCVGFDNYKPFWLFVTYSTVLSIYVAIEAGYETFLFFQDPEEFYRTQPSGSDQTQCEGGIDCTSSASDIPELDLAPVAFIALAILGAFFALAVGSLAGYHWWLACNNITTLENLTHSYPSVLLDDSPPRSTRNTASHAANRRNWKPDHLLTRDERNRLRREARDINVYDRGWKNNLRDVFGDRSIFLAFLPWVRAYHPLDRDAGHFFRVNEDKLGRLRCLTMELRTDGNFQPTYYSESESSSDSERADDQPVDEDFTPLTVDSGINGDDEDEASEDGIDSVARREGRTHVQWFEGR